MSGDSFEEDVVDEEVAGTGGVPDMLSGEKKVFGVLRPSIVG